VGDFAVTFFVTCSPFRLRGERGARDTLGVDRRRCSRLAGRSPSRERYDFKPERFRNLHVPVLLQIGTESPRDIYVTDALAAVLPDARIGELTGQAHEGMTTAPAQYAEAVARFLLAGAPPK
jgi:pimeloyl-ACP methyl ester carboxylesterase